MSDFTIVQKSNNTNFQWITKSRSYSRCDCDITIGLGKSSGKERVTFIFRNKTHEKFGSEYIIFGIDGDRLWIAPADMSSGYKIAESKTSTTPNKYAQCGDEMLVAWAHKHFGDYRLNKDSKSGMYFVDARLIA